MQTFPENLYFQVKDRYVLFSYLSSLIAYSHAGHQAREPFSMLATSAPVPRLNHDEDAIASERGALLAVLIMREDQEGELKLKACDDFMGADWKDAEGNTHPSTVDMIARSIYYAVLHVLNERALSPQAKAQLKAFWERAWPEYAGQPVTKESIAQWQDYVSQREMDAMPLAGKVFTTANAIGRRMICDIGRFVASVNAMIFPDSK